MSASFDNLPISGRWQTLGRLLLLISIFYGLSVYAAGEEPVSTPAATSLDNNVSISTDSEASVPDFSTDASNASVTNSSSSLPTTMPEPIDPPPIIRGESTNNAQIETTPTPQKDNDIRQRISGIFSEIEGLQAVNVSVTQGVVTLTGETPNEKKAQQAINLTNRLTDVVTVDDQIDRTLDVQDNVTHRISRPKSSN